MKLIKTLLAVSILLTAQISFAQQKNDDDAAVYAAYYLMQKQAKDRKEAEEKKQREVNYHAKIEAVKVKNCSLIVPNNTPNELMQALMNIGYRPMNVLPQFKNSAELTGVPYFGVKSRVFLSDLFFIGVTGEAHEFYSARAEGLPACTEN